jgi:electron transfer flavoprotein-quinone oxidoreductase
MDLAMVSGVAAARAILVSRDSTRVGPAYMAQLEQLKLLAQMKLFAGWPDILENPRLFTAYPRLVNASLRFLFTVDGEVPEKMTRALAAIVRQHVTVGQLLADAWRGFRAI